MLEESWKFFPALKKQAMKLNEGEGLEIIQSFNPIPLYEVMEDLGYEYHTEEVKDNEYHAYFYRVEVKESEKVAGTQESPDINKQRV